MSGNPGTDLQEGIKMRLENSVALQSVAGRQDYFFDTIPDKEDLPFILYEPVTEGDWGTSTEEGKEVRVRIHFFSKEKSSLQTRKALDIVEDLLHNYTEFVLTGSRLVLLRREDRTVLQEPDGKAWHGFTIFRALIEEN